MKRSLSEVQTAFYTQNGLIEFEIPHTLPPESSERDQWRGEAALQSFIVKNLGPLALVLTGKVKLRLGYSEWITKENRPKKAGRLKEWLSLQNLAICICMAPNPIIPAKRSSLGILPLPSTSSNVLFFRPDLNLDWPHVTSDLFLIILTLENGVYIHNPNDPKTTYLKTLGYNYGDQLKTNTHPLIVGRSVS